MPKKTDSELALEEKVTLARTLVRWKKSAEAKRELNLIETQILEAHEDKDGNYSSIDTDALVAALTAKKELAGGS